MADEANVTAFIYGVAGGLLSGALGRIFGEWGLQYLFGPKLQLSFDHNESGYVVDTTVSRMEPPFPLTMGNEGTLVAMQYDVRYVRVRVENLKRRMASNCVVYLIGVKRQLDHGPYVDSGYHDSIPLRWSYSKDEEPVAKSVPKGVNIHCDVFSTMITSSKIMPCLTTHPTSYETLFENRGVYLFELMLTADGVPPERLDLKVHWNGEWNSFDIAKCVR